MPEKYQEISQGGEGVAVKLSRMHVAIVAVFGLLATMLSPVGAATQIVAGAPADIYGLANGCFRMRAQSTGELITASGATFVAGGAGQPFFFKATDLGSYLMYGNDVYLAASDGVSGQIADEVAASKPGGIAEGLTSDQTTKAGDALATSPLGTATGRGKAIVAASKASELADWTITDHGDGAYRWSLPATGQSLTVDGEALGLSTTDGEAFTFEPATGCATFPEVEVNVTGTPAAGASSFAEVTGYLDAHLHAMAYEFVGGRVRCGRPWHRFGVEQALVDCPDHEPGGVGAAWENLLAGGTTPVHDTAGWPTFPYWPKNNSLTHEQVYYKWLERAWRGGLRFMVNLLVDNSALCDTWPYKRNSCNEMDGVRLQAERLREFERYIDAQSGGPGEGWFRIVKDPFEARAIINSGKLAVVMGIEVSTPLDCGLTLDTPMCDEQQISNRLTEMHDLGVRQMELTNKFDNALTGVTGDSGASGPVVNSGNQHETGYFWKFKTCEGNSQGVDKTQMNLHDDTGSPDELSGRDTIFSTLAQGTGTSGAAPAYPPGPHCNVRGLSDLGRHLLASMIGKGMIFDPDHMSALGREQAMDFMEARGYSGIVSSHSWADDKIYERVLKAGGFVAPHAGGSTGFVGKWNKQKNWKDPRFTFGVGYGSDVNGFSNQGSPRGGSAVTYPFTALGGVVVDKQVSGRRTYDVNKDGVAHYGLYVDWVEDLRKQAGDAIVADLARAAEAYLQMWERAIKIAPDACRSDVADLTDEDVSELTVGMSPRKVMETLGQPSSRTGTAFTFCMAGARTATVTFSGEVLTAVAVS